MRFLVNPGRGKKSASTKRRRRRANSQRKGTTMAKRRKAVTRRSAARKNPAVRRRSHRAAVHRGRRRSSARRNPPVVSILTAALKDAAVGAAAQLVTQKVAAMLPNFVDAPSNGGQGKWGPKLNQVLTAAAVGIAARAMLGAEVGRAAIQGALQAPLVDVVNTVAPGMLGSYVSGYVSPPGMRAYVSRPGVASYPTAPRLLAGDPTSGGVAASGIM